MKYFIAATLILINAICLPANAEPDSVVRFLMNDPVSMLDWGIFRLEDYLRPFNKSLVLMIQYHFNSNRIVITAEPKEINLGGTKYCKDTIVKIRQELTGMGVTGAIAKGITYPDTLEGQKEKYLFITNFFHNGYTNGLAAKEMDRKMYYDIPNIIKIDAFDNALSKRTKSVYSIKCSGALTSNNISVTAPYKF